MTHPLPRVFEIKKNLAATVVVLEKARKKWALYPQRMSDHASAEEQRRACCEGSSLRWRGRRVGQSPVLVCLGDVAGGRRSPAIRRAGGFRTQGFRVDRFGSSGVLDRFGRKRGLRMFGRIGGLHSSGRSGLDWFGRSGGFHSFGGSGGLRRSERPGGDGIGNR